MNHSYKIKVAITQGDINGVGYEVILKTLSDPRIIELCTPIVYGIAKVASYHRKALDLAPLTFNIINSAEEAEDGKLNFINCSEEEVKVEFGQSTESAGFAAFQALVHATDEFNNGMVDVLVTAPINKHNIQSEEFKFPGHTEYLENKCGKGDKSLMILMQESLRVALVTTHMPLKEVPSHITMDNILEKLNLFNQTLKQDFNIQKPKIAVLSLNPHSGEEGLLGMEEIEVIKPAINQAMIDGMLCFGPYAADGFFGSMKYKEFDGVLAMYHDQGLAPFKTIAMENGVNYTAGIPLIRTSPDHGTAYDIAGKGIASEESFRQALYSAIDAFRNRIEYFEIRKNPLRKQYFDRSGDNEKLDLTSEPQND